MSDDKRQTKTPIGEQIAICIIEQETALEEARSLQFEAMKQQRRADVFADIIATLERREQEQ